MSDFIRRAYQHAVWALILRGLLAIAVGLFVLWRPLDSIAAFALLIAWWSLFSGISQVVHAIELRAVFGNWWVLLLSGVVGIVFGIAALAYYPGLSLAFAVLWVGWWLAVTGALAIYISIAERAIGLPWGWTAIAGALSVMAAAYALISPPATLATIMGFVAGIALVVGIVQLIGAFKLYSTKAAIGEALHAATAR